MLMLDIFFQSERHWNCSKMEFGLVSVLLAFSWSSLLFPKTLPFLIPHIFLVVLAHGKCFQQWPFPRDTLLKSCLPWRTWEILLQILIEIGCYLFNIYWRDKNYVKFNTTKCYINVRFYSEMIMHCCIVNQFLEGGYLLATVWLFYYHYFLYQQIYLPNNVCFQLCMRNFWRFFKWNIFWNFHICE